MGRLKRNSEFLAKAQQRATALQSIDPALDLGNGLSLASYFKEIQETQALEANYNQALTRIDALYNDLLLREKKVKDLSERMLSGIASRYGKDSNEYEQAGGTRRSERKKSTPKPTT